MSDDPEDPTESQGHGRLRPRGGIAKIGFERGPGDSYWRIQNCASQTLTYGYHLSISP